jgi:hypothetical protein
MGRPGCAGPEWHVYRSSYTASRRRQPHYRVKSARDGHLRALLESQMRPMPPEPVNEQPSEAAEVQPESIVV